MWIVFSLVTHRWPKKRDMISVIVVVRGLVSFDLTGQDIRCVAVLRCFIVIFMRMK